MDFYYRCTECDARLSISPTTYLCPHCHEAQQQDEPLRGILEVGLVGSPPFHFTIMDLLPVERKWFPSIPVGNTALWEPELLRKKLGLPGLFLKDDTANPTGSLKDRASFLVAAFARKHKIQDIVVASTGNAASSMAGIGAAAGLNVTIFLPEKAPTAKRVQSLQYGATVIPVRGNYDRAFDLSLVYAEKKGALTRNTALNPLTIEGKKTVALEIFEQLGRIAPDYVFVPTGDGVILSGVCKGFRDLMDLSLITKMPVLVAVQAEGSNAICRAFEEGVFTPKAASTVADSISVDVPRAGYNAIRCLKSHGGMCVTVNDSDILSSQQLLASCSGLFAEPAGAASLAGLLTAKDTIGKDKIVVLMVTGSGLKDIDAASSQFPLPGKAIDSLEEIL